jgi:hypothetical protein
VKNNIYGILLENTTTSDNLCTAINNQVEACTAYIWGQLSPFDGEPM